MLLAKKAAFSKNGEFFAFANEQGVLTIWETDKNTINQECDLKLQTHPYTCSCIIWSPIEIINSNHHSESNQQSLSLSCQYVVIGTECGTVILFDINNSKFISHFETVHSEAINDLSWHRESSCLFSCSSDRSISVWDVSTGMLKMKFRDADEEMLYTLCVIDGDNLLVASSTITWWNIKEQCIVKKFFGHSSPVLQLLPVYSSDTSACSYFLSASATESKITAWSVKSTRSLKNGDRPTATFDTNNEIVSMDVTDSFSKAKPMFLSSVTTEGSLVLFKHVLNGFMEKDLLPQITVKVVPQPENRKNAVKSKLIPIIASRFSSCSEFCLIAYGEIQNPIFEKIRITDCPKILTLTGKSPNSSLQNISAKHNFVSTNGLVSKPPDYSSPKRKKITEKTVQSCENTHFEAEESSSLEIKQQKSSTAKNVSARVKKKEEKIIKEKEIPIAISHRELLHNPAEVQKSFKESIETDNAALLNIVLHCDDCQTIENCVKRCPSNKLKFVLSELHTHLDRPTERYNHSLLLWVKEILNTHLLYIIQTSDLTKTLNFFSEHIDSLKVSETIKKMSLLKGLLNVLRIKGRGNDCSDSDTEEPMES